MELRNRHEKKKEPAYDSSTRSSSHGSPPDKWKMFRSILNKNGDQHTSDHPIVKISSENPNKIAEVKHESTEIKNTSRKLKKAKCNEKQEIVGVNMQNPNLGYPDEYGSLNTNDMCSHSVTALKNMYEISASTNDQNSLEPLPFSDQNAQSKDKSCGNIYSNNRNLPAGYQYSSSPTTSGIVSYQYPYFSDSATEHGNRNHQDASSISTFSEQSGKYINAIKKNCVSEKSPSISSSKWKEVAKDKEVDSKTLVFQSDPLFTRNSSNPLNVEKHSIHLQDNHNFSGDHATKPGNVNCRDISGKSQSMENGESEMAVKAVEDVPTTLVSQSDSLYIGNSGNPLNVEKQSIHLQDNHDFSGGHATKPGNINCRDISGKSQSMKNGESEMAAKVVEAVPTTLVSLSDPSFVRNTSNLFSGEKESTDLGDWEMVKREQVQNYTDVERKSTILDHFHNQSSSISNEEGQHDLYDAKGILYADKLRNLPEELARKAEEDINKIIYNSEVAARMLTLKMGNVDNNFPYNRKSLKEMLKNAEPSNYKLPSHKNERDEGKSPNSPRLYPSLLEFNGNCNEQENDYMDEEPEDQSLNEQPEDQSLNEQESLDDVGEQCKPANSQKNVNYVPECEKRHSSTVRPKESRKDPPPKPTVTYINVKWICALIVIIFAVAAGIFGAPVWIWEFLPKTFSPPVPTFATRIENLKGDFSQQPPMTFKIVNHALRKVTEPNPEAPAIIILLAERGAEEIAGQLARKIAESVSLPDSVLVISGHTYHDQEPDTAKKDIDNLINENLKEDQLSAVLVERLDYIPAEAAIIFHTYCDHENAPFKHAVYVMTIASKEIQLKSKEPKVWDKMVQEHLYESWSTGGNDQISSLLSRLTVSVAAIVSSG